MAAKKTRVNISAPVRAKHRRKLAAPTQFSTDGPINFATLTTLNQLLGQVDADTLKKLLDVLR